MTRREDESPDSPLPKMQSGDAVPGYFVPVVSWTSTTRRTISISSLLARQWLWIIGCALALGAVMFAIAWTMPPRYEATILVAPADDPSQSGALDALGGQVRGLASLVGIGSGGQSDLRDRALAVLRSRTFTAEFVGDHGAAPVLFPDGWDEGQGDWRLRARPTLEDVVERFDRNVRFISEDRRTGFVRVSIRLRDPDLAAAWANALVVELNERMRRNALKEAEARLEYLRAEAGRTESVEVRQAIYRLMENEFKSAMLANVRHDYAFRIIDPATAPDAQRPVAPRRGLMTALGVTAGLLLGVLIAVYFETRRKTE